MIGGSLPFWAELVTGAAEKTTAIASDQRAAVLPRYEGRRRVDPPFSLVVVVGLTVILM
jgi:hypothetical protein